MDEDEGNVTLRTSYSGKAVENTRPWLMLWRDLPVAPYLQPSSGGNLTNIIPGTLTVKRDAKEEIVLGCCLRECSQLSRR